jgi:hypothetical protein
VDLSGIIFVVLALAWAVYLIPKALKHHDEVARTRSVDRFSTAMRVLARREPVDRRNARLVVTPPRSTERVLIPSRPAVEPPEPTAPATRRHSVATRRAAVRAAARRRRHVTSLLLGLDAVVVTLAAFAVVPWWSVAIPTTLTVLYLVLCRRQVTRENEALWAPSAAAAAGPARRAVRVDAPYGAVQETPAAHDAEPTADEDTVQIPVAELETVAVSVETVDGGSLWDPLPVTLPTYVNKARAARTVRTIDLGAPGTWSSGRDEADSALVEESGAAEPVEESVEHEPWRAVGS